MGCRYGLLADISLSFFLPALPAPTYRNLPLNAAPPPDLLTGSTKYAVRLRPFAKVRLCKLMIEAGVSFGGDLDGNHHHHDQLDSMIIIPEGVPSMAINSGTKRDGFARLQV